MTTAQQDKDFARKLINESIDDIMSAIEKTLLDLDYGWVVEWVGANLEPEDVFTSKDLAYWASQNGYIESGEDE